MIREWIQKHSKTTIGSYRNLRRALGILGISLPVILILGGYFFASYPIQFSVSHYYHTNMRDVLVGLLGAVSLFLMTYTGYGVIDNLITWAIGLAGAGVVVFPCPTALPSTTPVGIFQLTQGVSGSIHFICAGVFFFLLAINSLFLFTSSDQVTLGKKKKQRNLIYILSGIVILTCLVTLLLIHLVAQDFFSTSSVALVFEAIMLVAFGVSWLVKGEIPPFRDKKPAI